MAGSKFKKATLLFARTDLDDILRECINLSAIDVTDTTLPDDDPELTDFVKCEVIDLKTRCANRDTITLLGTDSTLYLTGWITAKSEKSLAAIASNYICAWEVEEPNEDDFDDVPIVLRRPKFLHRFYKGPRKLFSPIIPTDNAHDKET